MSDQADKHPRPRSPHARAVRLTYGGIALGLVIVSVLAADSAGFALLDLCIAALSIDLTALMMRNGELLPRGRPLEQWETRALSASLLVASVLGVALLADYAATQKHVYMPLAAVAVVASFTGGFLALYSMMRG